MELRFKLLMNRDFSSRNPLARLTLNRAMETRFRILLRGQQWSGAYRVEGGRVYVSSAYGSEDRPKGRRKPEAVAGEILHGLVEAWSGRSATAPPGAKAGRAERAPIRT